VLWKAATRHDGASSPATSLIREQFL